MKVKTENLLLLAALVWLIAGVNVLSLGIKSYLNQPISGALWALIVGTCVVFILFHVLVFSKMVGKHTERIRGYEEERMHAWKFFDRKSFMIMAVMMTVGIGLRAFNLVPEWFIAFFYTGLGCALTLAGISFALHYFKSEDPQCPVNSRLPKKDDN